MPGRRSAPEFGVASGTICPTRPACALVEARTNARASSWGCAMIEAIRASLVPVFFVMILGFAAGLTKDIDNRNIGSLNALVMDFALPAALFTAMAQTPREAMIGQANLALALLLAMLIVFTAAFVIETRLFGTDRRESALSALTASAPNVGSAGLPVIAAVFSRSASVSVAVAVAIAGIVMTPLSLVLLEAAGPGERSVSKIVRGALVKPIVIAPVLGLLLSLGGISLPSLLDSGLTLVGQGASGAALFLTGLVLSAQPFRFNTNVGVGADRYDANCQHGRERPDASGIDRYVDSNMGLK